MAYDNNQSGKEENAKNILEGFVKNYKIFIDTCSLLHFAADKFWKNIIPFLDLYQNKVFIPLRCVEEVHKKASDSSNPELAQTSSDCLKKMEQLIKSKFVEIRGEQSDNFADNVFQVVFTKFRMQYKLLLITQDKNLAKDILALNSSKAVKAEPVLARRINQYGFLSDFTWNTENKKNEPVRPEVRTKKVENELNEDEHFRICKTVTKLDDSQLKVNNIPTENELVYTSHGHIRLGKEIAAGGEGIIYKTDTPYVAKIYKKENNTRRKHEKIKLMLSKLIECEGICYPVAALYNAEKEFVGYLMPEAKGMELQKSIFIKPLFLKNFPNWKKRDTVELCVTILEKIKYLHDRNIIMGDINPANILVVSPKEVYFVDTDSYQVEDFPCPVGTNNYTAPEIQRKHFPDFLRSIGNENFAVATLLFMIMLPGKPPYSQQGGEDPIQNIINMDFSYPFGDNSNKKTPDGPWRYIWSHLTYDLKEAFYNTFRKGGKYSTENTRLTVNKWLSIFKHYLELLDSGKFGKQDQMSEELFPTRHKKNPKVEYIKCKKCGKKIVFTNYQKYVKNAKHFDVCPKCFEYGNKVKIRQHCIDCKRQFEITNNQYDFYKSKYLELPKRCKVCRDAKKNYVTDVISHSTTKYNSLPNNASSGSKGSFCFISTVVCGYLGKSDDCDELSTLRAYRDTWLRNQPGGQQLITEYYNKAPLIVSRLEVSDEFGECCEYLWQNYIQPCLVLIDEKQYEACKERYTEMFKYMQLKFTDDKRGR